MTKILEIIYTSQPSSEEIQALYDGIESFGFFVYSDSKKVVAGCTGAILYGCLYIDSLWVDDALRHQDLGTRLMTSATNLGKKRDVYSLR